MESGEDLEGKGELKWSAMPPSGVAISLSLAFKPDWDATCIFYLFSNFLRGGGGGGRLLLQHKHHSAPW